MTKQKVVMMTTERDRKQVKIKTNEDIHRRIYCGEAWEMTGV